MALNFPDSPTNGQIYEGFYWDNTVGVWQQISSSDLTLAADFSNTPTGTYTDSFDYKYISFTSDGTLTVTRGGYADILVVGGGGAGGQWYGGGGGAGGMLYIENAYLPAGSLDVVVGAGGSTPTGYRSVGQNGEASRLWQYIAPGGGGGGYNNNASSGNTSPGLNGGSGGGGSNTSLAFGLGIVGLGNNGGPGGSDGSGGGGAGEPGDTDGFGYGGDGLSNSITGSAVIYAGGGAGGASGANGVGGGAGGGAGRNEGVSTPNLGGGGGGGGTTGDGGSGIVIVRVKTELGS